MPRFVRNLAVLVKRETVYGTDSVPTGAANAMQMSNVQVEPMAGQQLSRDLLLPHMGHQGVFLTGTHGTLQGDVELAGPGAAGDAPAWGPLVRACGFAEVISAGVDVQYAPMSGSFEAASIYYNLDGVRHVLLGVRGTFTLQIAPLQIPRFRFSLTGLSGTIADAALPAVDLTSFVRPVPVSKANTMLVLHGWSAVAESLSIDIAGTVEPRFLIGHESIQITDRQATGSAVVEATSLATKDWFAIAAAHTLGAMALQHGTAAGNICKVDAPKVQIGRPTQGASQGIANYSLPLMFTPDAGNDELLITVQ